MSRLLSCLLLFLSLPTFSRQRSRRSCARTPFSNGLKLLVVERHTSPTFSAYLTLGVGSVNETDQTRGVAHLLEHMLFKGTKTLGTLDYEAEKIVLQKIADVGGDLTLNG